MVLTNQSTLEYEVKNGIPIMYPDNMDFIKLHEEENLAKDMKKPLSNFESTQWKDSKQEFWDMVKHNTCDRLTQKSFINIGCGYDNNFINFEHEGNVFINFDIIYDMLYTLHRDTEAKFCVTGDVNNLPFKKDLFDYVVCIDVIHHEYSKLEILLKSFHNLLKPGGILFLEEPNAWGIFQLPKSILLPKPLYSFLRRFYYKLKPSDHKPADYEFPTSLGRVKKILKGIGFSKIIFYPNTAYPNTGPIRFKMWNFFNQIGYFQKYHNYHYMLSCIKDHD